MFRPLADKRDLELRRAVADTAAAVDVTYQVGELITTVAARPDEVTNDGAEVAGAALGVIVGFAGPNGEVLDFGTDPNVVRPAAIVPDGNADLTEIVYIPIDSRRFRWSAILHQASATTPLSDLANTYFNMEDVSLVDETSVDVAPGVLTLMSEGHLPPDVTGGTNIVVKFRRGLLLD
jgi:hypothetical protein